MGNIIDGKYRKVYPALPYELLIEIYEYLSLADLAHCLITCKKWKMFMPMTGCFARLNDICLLNWHLRITRHKQITTRHLKKHYLLMALKSSYYWIAEQIHLMLLKKCKCREKTALNIIMMHYMPNISPHYILHSLYYDILLYSSANDILRLLYHDKLLYRSANDIIINDIVNPFASSYIFYLSINDFYLNLSETRFIQLVRYFIKHNKADNIIQQLLKWDIIIGFSEHMLHTFLRDAIVYGRIPIIHMIQRRLTTITSEIISDYTDTVYIGCEKLIHKGDLLSFIRVVKTLNELLIITVNSYYFDYKMFMVSLIHNKLHIAKYLHQQKIQKMYVDTDNMLLRFNKVSETGGRIFACNRIDTLCLLYSKASNECINFAHKYEYIDIGSTPPVFNRMREQKISEYKIKLFSNNNFMNTIM
jgi:hypothetical protein